MRHSRGKFYSGGCPDSRMPKEALKGSVGAMIEQIDGLRGTKDLTDWEQEFVVSIVNKYHAANKITTGLSGKQVGIVERIWGAHFAG